MTDNKVIMTRIERQKHQIHPFHLVEASPWPIFTSFSLFGLAFNFTLTMHSYIDSKLWIFLNILCLVYSMSLWFRDVITEGTYLGNHTIAVKHGINMAFILFVVSEGMFFFGIFWAYIHSALAPTIELGGVWPPVGIEAIGPLDLPLLNTILLLSSGATVTYAHHGLIARDRKAALLGLLSTVLLAFTFCICQYIEYSNATFTISDGVFGSTFYLGTGLTWAPLCLRYYSHYIITNKSTH